MSDDDTVEGRIQVGLTARFEVDGFSREWRGHSSVTESVSTSTDPEVTDPDIVLGGGQQGYDIEQPEGYTRPFQVEKLFGMVSFLAERLVNMGAGELRDDFDAGGEEPPPVEFQSIDRLEINFAPDFATVIPPHELDALADNPNIDDVTVRMSEQNLEY